MILVREKALGNIQVPTCYNNLLNIYFKALIIVIMPITYMNNLLNIYTSPRFPSANLGLFKYLFERVKETGSNFWGAISFVVTDSLNNACQSSKTCSQNKQKTYDSHKQFLLNINFPNVHYRKESLCEVKIWGKYPHTNAIHHTLQ